MLYELWLRFHDQVEWLNILRYQTFRAMVAFLFTFALVLLVEPRFIDWLRRRGVKGQPIRTDGPKDHQSKSGTPTMGGFVMIFGVVVATLLLADLSNAYIWVTLLVMGGYGALGFLDDWRKITKQNTKGVSGRMKLAWQTGVAVLAGLLLIQNGHVTDLTFPFFKAAALPLGLLFIPFVALVTVGASNAVNLTDGLDGLAIGPVMTVAFAYAIFAYIAGNARLSGYLGVAYVPGAGELSIVLSAMMAGGLGFLWYNTFPAQVFMGDIGALALGGTLGVISVIVKQELLLVLAGGIFVVEALSVIIQVYSFKLTGRRVFRMAPIHHHYELKGWAEPKIIVRFWIISIVLALLSLTTLKIR